MISAVEKLSKLSYQDRAGVSAFSYFLSVCAVPEVEAHAYVRPGQNCSFLERQRAGSRELFHLGKITPLKISLKKKKYLNVVRKGFQGGTDQWLFPN